MLPFLLKIVGFCSFLGIACGQLTSDTNLEVVTTVILSRHSIKTPSTFSTEPLTGCFSLPNGSSYWGANASDLLHEGLLVAEGQGRFLQERYASLHTCDTNSALALADDEQRDEVTAQGLLNGLYNGCGAVPSAVSSPEVQVHLMFSEGQDGNMYPGCSRATEAQTQGIVGDNVDSFFHSNYMPELRNISKFANCPGLLSLATTWKGGYWTTFDGGLKIASKYADTWLVQALTDKVVTVDPSIAEVVSLETAVSMAKVSEALFDMYRNAFNLQNFGSEAIASILASLDQVVNGTQSTLDDVLMPKMENKIVFLVAHDVHISFMRQVLNLNWESPGWLWNQPTYAGQVVHELFQHKTTAEYFVRLGFVSDSPEGMLDTEATGSTAGFSWVPIAVPGCSSSSSDPYMCTYSTYRKLLSARLSTKCMTDAMKSFINGVVASSEPKSSGNDISTISLVLIILGSVLAAIALAAGLAVFFWQRNFLREHESREDDGREYNVHVPEFDPIIR